MKAVSFEKYGLENLRVLDFPIPKLKENDVLIRVIKVGLNPIDYFSVTGIYGLNSSQNLIVKPFPHIPGVEFTGEIEKVGSNAIDEFNIGDHVVVYNRLYDSDCRFCHLGLENMCLTGGLLGVHTNGGLAEYFVIDKKNVFKIPTNVDWDVAASLSVCALTSFHALNESKLKKNENLIVFGASGSTGQFAIQIGNLIGAHVIGISSKSWISDLGTDLILSSDENLFKKINTYTNSLMADVVLNSIGEKTWDTSIELLGVNGRLVLFGVLTGNQVKLNLQNIYLKNLKIIGTNGGTISELKNLINLSTKLKVKKWKEFSLDGTADALRALFSEKRNGRIFIKI